jgi:hypothetical protein
VLYAKHNVVGYVVMVGSSLAFPGLIQSLPKMDDWLIDGFDNNVLVVEVYIFNNKAHLSDIGHHIRANKPISVFP